MTGPAIATQQPASVLRRDFVAGSVRPVCAPLVEIGAGIDAHLGQRNACIGEREPRVRAADVADEYALTAHRGSIRAACSSVSWRTNISSVSTQS